MAVVPTSRSTTESAAIVDAAIRIEQASSEQIDCRAVVVYVFATNMWFDSNLALARSNSPIVTALLEKLKRSTNLSWSPGPSSSKLEWYDDELGAPPLFPTVLATCDLQNDGVAAVAAGYGFAVNSLKVELSDLGCGAVVLDIRRVRDKVAVADLGEPALRGLSEALRTEIGRIASTITTQMADANFDDQFGISPTSLLRLAPRPPVDSGIVMWTVAAWLLTGETEEARSAIESSIKKFVPDVLETATAPNSQYYFGTMACAAIVPSVDGPDAKALVDVVSAMHHWWSGSWLLDALMLTIFSRSHEMLSGASLEDLETLHRDLGRLQRLSGTVSLRIDTFLLGTSGAQYAIWAGLAGAWALDHNLRAIDKKGRDLSGLTGAVDAAIRNLRDKGIARVLGIFTGVSVISGLISVTVFVATEPFLDEQDLALRFSIAVGLTLTVVVSFLVGKYSRRAKNL